MPNPFQLLETRYHRELAVQYADYWAYRRNPQFDAFDELGGDCTNFVSQAQWSNHIVPAAWQLSPFRKFLRFSVENYVEKVENHPLLPTSNLNHTTILTHTPVEIKGKAQKGL